MKTQLPILQQTTDVCWRHFRCMSSKVFSQIDGWLLDPSSTTQRVKSIAGGFCVRVLMQAWLLPSHSEASLLGIPQYEVALIREVELSCGDEVWMYGRSVFPNNTLTGKEKRLYKLGNQPLGEVLFADPTMRRSDFELARLANLWARRSVFYLSEKPLLLTEIFLPVMENYLRDLQQCSVNNA